MLVLKGNHRALHADAGQLLEDPRHVIADRHSTAESDHGSIETRASMVSSEIEGLQNRRWWPGLAAVGRVIRTRETAARATNESAYYLLSAIPERLGRVVRSHWGVENRLYWVLNVVMNEDQARSRNDNSAYNFAILRHMALNLMQNDRSKVSLRSKFNLAG